MPVLKFCVLCTVLFFFAHTASVTCGVMRSPTEQNKKAVKKNYEEATSSPKIAFKWVISFFQTYISPMDGPRCQLYPTCSGYGKEAFSRNGSIAGFIMTADRLMRDNSDAYLYYPLIKVGRHYYYYDPVENNEYLFVGKKFKILNKKD